MLPLVIAAITGATFGAVSLRAYQYLVAAPPSSALRIQAEPLNANASTLAQNERQASATSAAAPVTGSGALVIQTEPSQLTIVIDDVVKGKSPLSLAALTPGQHRVEVRGGTTVVRSTVSITAGERTVLVMSPMERAAAPVAIAAAGGWLTVSAPVMLTIRESGRLLGTTESDRLMVPAGEHSLEVGNDALGFKASRTVTIEAGKTALLPIDVPDGILNINAQPWAEVWIDGRRLGETPIANVTRPIGSHEVILRHPDLGERRETVTVTLKQPTRLGVDMRRK
jgi:hypothetical protein